MRLFTFMMLGVAMAQKKEKSLEEKYDEISKTLDENVCIITYKIFTDTECTKPVKKEA